MVRVVEQIYAKVCTYACRIYVALYNINKFLFFQPQVSLHVNGTKVQRGWRRSRVRRRRKLAVSDLAVDMRIGRLMMSRTRDRHSSSIPCSLFSLLAYNIYTPAPPYVSHYPSPRSSLYIFPYFIFDISFVHYISLTFQTEQSTQITFLPQVSIFDQIQNVCTYHNSQ